MEENPKRILLIWIGRVGDLIVSTPFIRALKARYPEAEITLLVRNYVYDLAKLIPDVDRVSVLPNLKNPYSLIAFSKNYLFRKFDICVDLNPSYSRTSGTLSRLSFAPMRVGYKAFRSHWFYNYVVAEAKEAEHMLCRYKRLADFFGAKFDSKMSIEIPKSDKEHAQKIFNELKLSNDKCKVLIHAGNFKKFEHRWPEEKFIELTNKILKHENVEVIYMAGPGEEAPVKAILSKLPDSVKFFKADKIGVSAQVMKKMDIFILNPTGTMHLAAAVGVTMVIFHSGYSYACWRTLQGKSISLVPESWLSCRDIEVKKTYRAFLAYYDSWKVK
jgi:ADP-heptose:LPS heptosyltransferase